MGLREQDRRRIAFNKKKWRAADEAAEAKAKAEVNSLKISKNKISEK